MVLTDRLLAEVSCLSNSQCRRHSDGRQIEEGEEEFLHEVDAVVEGLLGGRHSRERDAESGRGCQHAAPGIGQGGNRLTQLTNGDDDGS